MQSVVKYTLKQTVFLNVVFVILVLVGIFSFRSIPVENMPMVDIGKVFILTVYYGAAADDVEQLVTNKIEESLESLENVEYVQSNSYRNFSSIEVKFTDDSDYHDLYDELRFRVLNIKDELPAGADEPDFLWVDTNLWLPVIVAHICGDLPPRSLKRYAEDLRTQLLGVPDVRDVSIEGDYEDEFHVSLNPERLRRYGITFSQVVKAIAAANSKIPTGRFRTGDTAFMLDAGNHFRAQADVLETIVRRDGDGNFIRVRDLVTTARLHYRDPIDIPSVNGKSAVRLVVTKEELGNSMAISEQVKTRAREFSRLHAAEGIDVVFSNDSIIEINDSVKTLGGNLILGMTLVTAVLWLTLGFRNAMLTAVGIPFSFICSIIIMKLSGVTLNTISLFSFVLVTGIIVDDAVIIVENTYRHLQMGKGRRKAIIDATSEVMLPIISSALTTVLAFVPMLIMTGSTGDFFAIIPKTVTFALIASLLEALFILPVHILDWGPRKAMTGRQLSAQAEEDAFAHLQSGPFARLWTVYRYLVTWLLDHKAITFIGINLLFITAVAILLVSMLGLVPLIPVKFFPGNYFRYHVTLQTAAGTAIERTDTLIRDISRKIMSMGSGQAQSTAAYAGFYEDQDYVRHRGPNFGQVVVTLPDESVREFPENPDNDPMQHLIYMRRQLKDYVARTYAGDPARPVVQVFEESDGPPTGKAVNIRVQAATIQQAVEASDRLMAFMRQNPDMADLVDLSDNRPEMYHTIHFQPRMEAAYEYNLSPDQITAVIAGALNGMPAGPFRLEDEEVDLLVRMARTDDIANTAGAGLNRPDSLMDVPVVENISAPLFVRDLARADHRLEPNVRSRFQGRPTITLSADIRPGSKLSPAGVQKMVKNYYGQELARMPGVSLTFGGEFESTMKSYVSLGIAFGIAILGIYLVLASQFRDYFQPLIILTAVPFALIGVSFGLFVTRTYFTIGSFIAAVGLSGVAVNNTILLIDFMNKRLRQGRPMRQAVMESCAARMRPVLITTVTTFLGLLPMAIGIPHKSISWAPMATTFVAGLASATILALLVTPANFEFLGQIRTNLSRRKMRKMRQRQEQPFEEKV